MLKYMGKSLTRRRTPSLQPQLYDQRGPRVCSRLMDWFLMLIGVGGFWVDTTHVIIPNGPNRSFM